MNFMRYIQISLAIALWLFGGANGEGYEYIGCYKDTSSRALRYGPHNWGYTADTCSVACADYTYFALQANGWCCCDDDFDHATKYGVATNCPASKKGASWANDLFENIETTTTTTTTTETPRDCGILDIDGFLTECSSEFPGVSTNLTALEERVNTLEDEAQSVTDEFIAVNARIDEFGMSAAEAPPSMRFINDEPTGVDGVHVTAKDTLIISLLVINLIGMIYSHYRIQSKERRSFHGKKYAVQFDEETDMEPINT